MKKIGLFVSIALVSALVNCSRDAVPCTKAVSQSVIDAVPKAQLAIDIKRIDDYLTANSITHVEDPSGLRYSITTPGTGITPCLESKIVFVYEGRTLLASGPSGTPNPSTFDASTSPATFTLNELILGWQIAFLNFPAGTEATLYIPSGFGYGVQGKAPKIPGNSVLIFKVTLISI
jgi:FKBP-type peptidyl-prolyl cis-trans isomerase FkpA